MTIHIHCVLVCPTVTIHIYIHIQWQTKMRFSSNPGDLSVPGVSTTLEKWLVMTQQSGVLTPPPSFFSGSGANSRVPRLRRASTRFAGSLREAPASHTNMARNPLKRAPRESEGPKNPRGIRWRPNKGDPSSCLTPNLWLDRPLCL